MTADRAVRRVAVTGASGYLGTAVVRHLRARGLDVFAYGRRPADHVAVDVRERYTSWDLVRGPLTAPPDVDAVVHCASNVSDWGPYGDFAAPNVVGTRNVIDTWPSARLVHISSASIYNDHHAGVLFESDADPADRAAAGRVKWLSNYGRSKRFAECEVAHAARDWAILRPHVIYGPEDTQLMPRLLEQVRHGRLVLPGNGRATRISMVHIDNLVHAIDRALASDAVGVFNVVDSVTPTVHEAVTAAFAAVEVPVQITYLPRGLLWATARALEPTWRLVGARSAPPLQRYSLAHVAWDHVLDITQARERLGYAPKLAYPDSFATITVPTVR
ncbi:MAG: NAD-dependent epimerase/dehydratase [Thermoleophilia bacterium]|nr:NAD-dependent epimerase/dehydratase [Thermoleophilia bacterium]